MPEVFTNRYTFPVPAAVPTADAVRDVCGNPAAFGWTFAGNSLAPGVHVQTDNRYDFNLSYASFTVSAGSELLGQGFLAGDEVIGIGAVSIITNRSGGNTYDKARVTDLRQVNAKFGTLTQVGSTPLYAPDPDAIGSPYGFASHEDGNGGVGSIMLTVGSDRANTTLTSVRLDRSHHHDGTSSSALGTNLSTNYIGKYIAKTTGGGNTQTLDSFEFFLGNSELIRQGYTPIPLGAGFITTYHHVADSFSTEAYGQTAATAVPLPVAAWGGLALFGMIVTKRRRSANAA